MQHDVSFDGEDGPGSKRARRKNGRTLTRRGGRTVEVARLDDYKTFQVHAYIFGNMENTVEGK